jgi:hypothetical protein
MSVTSAPPSQVPARTTTAGMAILFLSSYSPLVLLIGLRLWEIDRTFALLVAGLGVVMAIAAYASVRLIVRGSLWTINLSEAEPLRDSSAGYLVSYLLPFLVVDLRDILSVTASLAFVALVGISYVRTRLLYLNPLLAFAGYALWRVQGKLQPGESPAAFFVLSRRSLAASSQVSIVMADNDVWFVHG